MAMLNNQMVNFITSSFWHVLARSFRIFRGRTGVPTPRRARKKAEEAPTKRAAVIQQTVDFKICQQKIWVMGCMISMKQ